GEARRHRAVTLERPDHGAFCRPPFAESQSKVLSPLACDAVAVNDVAVMPPTVTLTPGDCLKPVSSSRFAVYCAFAAKYASSAVARFRRSDDACALNPCARYAENCGIAIAARIPMIATTTSSSINVKPFSFPFTISFLRRQQPLARRSRHTGNRVSSSDRRRSGRATKVPRHLAAERPRARSHSRRDDGQRPQAPGRVRGAKSHSRHVG